MDSRPRKTEPAEPSAPVRVLLVEDDEDDFVLTRDMLAEFGPRAFELEWVVEYDAAIAAMREGKHDVYLVDYRLGAGSGMDLLRLSDELDCEAPIIMLTGQGESEADNQAMQLGAADYLVKGQIVGPLLARSIRYAISHKRTERHLREMAQIDNLTGLANRAMFLELMQRAIVRAKRSGNGLALYFIDLDNFKTINDSLGHRVGDLLLRDVAERLTDCLRASDTISRLGGDEFTVIAEKITSSRSAAKIADTILKALEAPFLLDGQEVFVTASIGIALYPEECHDADTLLKNADLAMYRAKDKGRNDYHFHSVQISNEADRRMALETRLRYAIEREEFVLHYQPQFDLHSGDIVGVEALIRWRDGKLGLIPPGEFIGVAEETGMIGPIGEWVMETACAQAAAWHADGLPDLTIAVNLSARQFRDKNLAQMIGGVIGRTGLEARWLEIELTEGHLAHDEELARKSLMQLKKLGIRIAIDDFGTGYSSLSHLTRFPVDTLKIDRNFVSNIATNANDATIVEAIIGLGHRLGMSVIAEGVETEEQLEFLKTAGCDIFQGFVLARPMASELLPGWLQSFRLAERKKVG